MDAIWNTPARKAGTGFLVGSVVGLSTGVLGFGDPWHEAIFPAIGSGIGLAIAFYIVRP